MAAKIKLMKLLQEIRGLAEITNRRPHPRFPGLFMIQLRSHVLNTTLSRRKRIIAIDIQGLSDIPHPVKITHLKVIPPAIQRPTTFCRDLSPDRP